MIRPSAAAAPTAMDAYRAAALLFMSAQRSRWAAGECARGAAAAALVSIASVVANAAVGLAVALVLAAAFLARRRRWLAQARSLEEEALAAEVAASFARSNWRDRTKWGLPGIRSA